MKYFKPGNRQLVTITAPPFGTGEIVREWLPEAFGTLFDVLSHKAKRVMGLTEKDFKIEDGRFV